MANYDHAFSLRHKDGRYDIKVGKSSTNTIPANLIVDSSRRDRSVYENPGHYVFDLISPYRDVTSIELTQANIPKTFYSISNDNNRITFTFDNTTVNGGQRVNTLWTATLPSGNYTSFDELVADIGVALNSAVNANNTPIGYQLGSGNEFSATYIQSTGKLRIVSPTRNVANNANLTHSNAIFIAGAFANADQILGLGSIDEDSGTNSITFSSLASLNPYRYLVLEIRGIERCHGNNSTLMDSFCVIPMTGIDTNNFGGDTINNDVYIHHFSEPLPKLDRMEITIKKPDGNICNFNGRDHFLVFEISSLSRPHKCN